MKSRISKLIAETLATHKQLVEKFGKGRRIDSLERSLRVLRSKHPVEFAAEEKALYA